MSICLTSVRGFDSVTGCTCPEREIHELEPLETRHVKLMEAQLGFANSQDCEEKSDLLFVYDCH